MLELRRSRTARQEGFTLVELLVVVLIIGILAAVAIPQFIGQQDKANAATVTALLRHGAVTFESYYTDGQTYPASQAAAVTAMQAIDPSIAWKARKATANPPANEVVIRTSKPTNYRLEATSGSTTYRYTKAANGKVTRTIVGGGTW